MNSLNVYNTLMNPELDRCLYTKPPKENKDDYVLGYPILVLLKYNSYTDKVSKRFFHMNHLFGMISNVDVNLDTERYAFVPYFYMFDSELDKLLFQMDFEKSKDIILYNFRDKAAYFHKAWIVPTYNKDHKRRTSPENLNLMRNLYKHGRCSYDYLIKITQIIRTEEGCYRPESAKNWLCRGSSQWYRHCHRCLLNYYYPKICGYHKKKCDPEREAVTLPKPTPLPFGEKKHLFDKYNQMKYNKER